MTQKKQFIVLVVGLLVLATAFVGIIVYQQSTVVTIPTTVPTEQVTEDLYYLFRQELEAQTDSDFNLLTRYLKALNGTVEFDTPITIFELTPFTRLADGLLADDTLSETARTNLQQELDQLIEPIEQLTIIPLEQENVSFIPTAQAATLCEEKGCYQEINVFTVGDYAYHILTKTVLANDVDQKLSPVIEQGLRDSNTTYSALGLPQNDTYVFIKPDAFPGGPQEKATASAKLDTVENKEVCRIDLWQADTDAFTQTAKDLQQIIAHEAFHCVSEQRWPEQYRGGLGVHDWWAEGTAEYFSNVVYPTVNHEYVWNDKFKEIAVDRSLYRMAYEANIFFQYLFYQIGNQGILDLIATLPSSGGYTEQHAALTAYPNIEDIWHQFGQAYLTNTILDSSGKVRMVTPLSYSTTAVDLATILRAKVAPFQFMVQQYQFQPPDQNIFILATEETNPGRYAVQKTGTAGWTTWPETIGVTKSCDPLELNVESYLLLITAVGDEPYELTINVAEEPLRDEQTPAELTIDPCLLGRWQADATSAKESLSELLYKMDVATDFTINSFDYTAESCIQNDNTISSQLDYFAQFMVAVADNVVNETLDLDITSLGLYSANGSTLTLYAPRQTGYATVKTDYIGYSSQNDILQPPPAMAELNYTCSGNDLELELPINPYPKMKFKKVQ